MVEREGERVGNGGVGKRRRKLKRHAGGGRNREQSM